MIERNFSGVTVYTEQFNELNSLILNQTEEDRIYNYKKELPEHIEGVTTKGKEESKEK